MSIRVTGNKGVRMITSISKSLRQQLINGGLAGFTLVEYGTVVASSRELEGGKPLILGQSYTRSNHAYKRGETDPVFADTGDQIQYTNVLVDFSMAQCAQDFTMRSYIILEGEDGTQLTLYGGQVVRSIGYIAWQNREAYAPDTDAYTYIWDIIRFVYGENGKKM